MKDAAVAGEDPRFYQHSGIDIPGTVRAVLKNATSSSTQSGSTITQQYVKNVLVQKCEVIADASTRATCYSAATETTVDRKLSEMRLAIGIEKKNAKNDILRQYLNIIGFGGAVYGIKAAANYYFNTTAADVSLPQAASLVAIVNNPVKFPLDKPNSETNSAAGQYEATQGRRNYILGKMLSYDKISSSQYEDAVATVIAPIITPPSTGCLTAGANAFFCDYVVKQLQNDPLSEDNNQDPDLAERGAGGIRHRHKLQHWKREWWIERLPARVNLHGVHPGGMAQDRPRPTRSGRFAAHRQLGSPPGQLPWGPDLPWMEPGQRFLLSQPFEPQRPRIHDPLDQYRFHGDGKGAQSVRDPSNRRRLHRAQVGGVRLLQSAV